MDRSIDDALLAAIRERPDDDAPRLVYADWLSERGDPRGEFIALQCRRASMADDDRQRAVLAARERELLAAHEATWRGAIAAIAAIRHSSFTRGFIDRVVIGEHAIAAHAAAIFAAAPTLYNLMLRHERDEPAHAGPVPPELARVRVLSIDSTDLAVACLASPHLAGAETLMFELDRDGRDRRGVRALVAARVDGLVDLRLGMTKLGADGLDVLVAWPGLARLRRLELNGCELTSVGGLARSAHVGALETLRLDYNRIGPDQAGAILSSPHLARLRDLDLSETTAGGALARTTLTTLVKVRYGKNRLSAKDAAALAGSTTLGGLEVLGLNGGNVDPVPVDPSGAAAIVASPRLARLSTIDLQQNRWGDQAAAKVIAAMRAGYRAIDLSYVGLGVASARALAENSDLASVASLELKSNPCDDDAIELLASSAHLRPRRLGLSWTPIGRRGLTALARAPLLAELHVLDLTSCKHLDAKAIAMLATSPYLTNLVRLELFGSQMGDAGARALARSPSLPRPLEITLHSSNVTPEGVATLRQAGIAVWI